LEECDSLESLRKWHWVDLFERDGYEMLLRALRVRADNLQLILQESLLDTTPGQSVVHGELFGLGKVSNNEVKRLPLLPNNARYIERFSIEGYIGRGGFADVYSAWEETSGDERKVAIKLFKYDGQPSYVQRYIQREALMAKKLSSILIDGLLKTYEVIWLPNKLGLLIVQEYVQGRNLHDRIASRMNLEAEESLSLAIKLCNTLENLHQLRVSHCDVKPLNIVVSSLGAPVLIDLGAARFFDETVSGDEIVVSIPYSSSKLTSGNPVDAQVDIYSLGVSLIHMLTGFPPWAGDNRESFEFSTEAIPPARLSLLPSEEEIREYLYLSLQDWRLGFINGALLKSLGLDGAGYKNISEFRQDLLKCLDSIK
jgi:serine/threonine protein kinase